LALDVATRERVLALAEAAAPHVSVLKIGLQTYLRDGAGVVDEVREVSGGASIFLDLKLHDIPNTVAGAVSSVSGLAAEYLTVHASGGAAMIAAAVQALPQTRVTAVTILTSLSEADLTEIGLRGPAQAAAVRLALLAVGAGARAVVCSPHEVAAIREAINDPGVVLITPGVRFSDGPGSVLADQARVSTPEQALRDGADLLVIGRPISGAADPAAAAASLSARLRGQA
jgi:orotidine-5'-phosphate decarboxylase